MSLTILRYGDPEHNPKDRIVDDGRLYHLDMIVFSPSAAYMRKEQLERNGDIVEITERMAPPSESMNFIPSEGFKDGGKSVHVFEVWYFVSAQRRKAMKSKRAASFGALHPARKPTRKGSFGAKKKPSKTKRKVK